MVPVDQTRYGMPHGNCMAASVASVLELPLALVPDFATVLWLSRLSQFGRRIGFVPHVRDTAPRGCAIACGMGPRGFRHAVVVCDGELAHDPHFSRAGLVDVEHYVELMPAVAIR